MRAVVKHHFAPGSGTAIVAADGAVVVGASADDLVVEIFGRFLTSALSVESLVSALVEVRLESLPPFALVHRSGDRARLLVRGSATARILSGEDEARRFDAADMTLWREEVLSIPCRLVLGACDSEELSTCWVTSGMVPAAALEYSLELLAPSPTGDDPPPVGTRRADAPITTNDLGASADPVDESGADSRQTLLRRAAVVDSDRAETPSEHTSEDPDHDGHTVIRSRTTTHAPEGGQETTGIQATTGIEATRCPAGHPNPPASDECRSCGALILDHAVRVIEPPLLGVLRFSDDRVVALDRPVVIGRMPSSDPIDGLVPAVVAIDDSTLSRFHASVVTEGWEVYLADHGSLNGTSVAVPGQAAVNCQEHERIPVPVGAVVNLGGAVTFRYDVA